MVFGRAMTQPPYRDLFIYELEGDARAAAVGLGPHFLGLWLEDDTSFLFFSQPAGSEVAALLQRSPGLSLRQEHHLTYEQWQGGLSLEPLELSCLSVVPAWSEEPLAGDRPVLRLDPGLVFGSGLHPTTRHCLELLCRRAELGPLGRVLDLGCGTGILACAAALLGAQQVLAVDLNPLCVQTTRANATRNHLDLEVAEGPAQDFLCRTADLVLANLHWEAMAGLLDQEEDLAHKKDLILSGITRSRVQLLRDRLASLGYNIRHALEAESTWFSLWARREE